MNLSDFVEAGIGKGFVLLIFAFIIACFLIVPFVLMVAWNFIMPQMFGLPELNILTSFGLCVIFSILFDGTKVVTSKN